MEKLLAVLEAMNGAKGALRGTYEWRARMCAKAVVAKVLFVLPVDDFSAQLNTLRDSI